MSLGQPEQWSRRQTDFLGDAFYPLYQRLFDQNSSFVVDLEGKLAEARMSHNVEMYLSVALALGVVSGVGLWLVGLVVGYALFATQAVTVGPLLVLPSPDAPFLETLRALRIPFFVFVTGIVFGLAGFSAGFGTVVMVPYMRSSSRRREINMLLPDAVSFMYALSIGGMSQLEIFEAVADAEDTYGEVSLEFRTILLETEYFDTDYRSAIRQQAFETPSNELNHFLTDMLSVIDSGGDMTRFFDDKKRLHFRTAKQEQQTILETLELFAEVFVTLSLFPLLLIIILIVLSMLGQGQNIVLYATVYLFIPVFGVLFIVIIATVIQDELGEGVLRYGEDEQLLDDDSDRGLTSRGLVEQFVGTYSIFDRISDREGTYRTENLLRRPDLFFRDHPLYTLAITVPVAAVIVAVAIVTGAVPTTWEGVVANPLGSTFVYLYLPLFVVGIPLTISYELNIRSRYGILDNFSENLRKLSSANETGLTLLDSIQTVARTSSGRFAEELEIVYAKSTYGMNLSESLIVFNNKYRLPPLARTIKLITKAQEASSQISAVLTTAAQAAENRDDIEQERRTRTRMQVVVVLMTYLTLLGVMAVLKVRFIDVLATFTGAQTGNAAASFTTGLEPDLLSLLFFHAVTLQAIVAGLVSGYIRDARLLSGMKYVIGLLVVALCTWAVVV